MRAGDEFSISRLKEVVESRETEPAAALVAYITEAVSTFAGTKAQADDLTVVVVKIRNPRFDKRDRHFGYLLP